MRGSLLSRQKLIGDFVGCSDPQYRTPDTFCFRDNGILKSSQQQARCRQVLTADVLAAIHSKQSTTNRYRVPNSVTYRHGNNMSAKPPHRDSNPKTRAIQRVLEKLASDSNTRSTILNAHLRRELEHLTCPCRIRRLAHHISNVLAAYERKQIRLATIPNPFDVETSASGNRQTVYGSYTGAPTCGRRHHFTFVSAWH